MSCIGQICKVCQKPKPEAGFGHKKKTCKKCESERAVRWAKNNRERKRANNNAYYKRLPSHRRTAHVKKYNRNHPEAYKAHQAVIRAIKSGKLVRQPCETCGSILVHAHHDDYSKPLEVRWLCQKHHFMIHLKSWSQPRQRKAA